MNMVNLKRWGELWVANSSALLSSSLPSVFTAVLEYGILGISLEQLFVLRVAYNIPKFALSPISGMITDTLRRKFLSDKHGVIRKSVVDGVALSLYELPLYVSCAIILGARPLRVALVCLMCLSINLAFGRLLYGLALDWIRAKFPLLRKDNS